MNSAGGSQRAVAVRGGQLGEQVLLDERRRGGEEGGQPLGRDERGEDPLALRPGAAHHPGLEVPRAVLALLLPPGAVVGEADLGRERVALAVERREPLGETPSIATRRSGATGSAQTTAAQSNRSPVAVDHVAAAGARPGRGSPAWRSGSGGRARRPSAGRRWPSPRRRAGTPRPRRSRSRARRPRPPCAGRRAATCARRTRPPARASPPRARRTALGGAPASRSQSPTESRSSRAASGCDHGSSGSTVAASARNRSSAASSAARSGPESQSPSDAALRQHPGVLAGRRRERVDEREPELVDQPAVRRVARADDLPAELHAAGRRPARSARRGRRAGCAPRARPRRSRPRRGRGRPTGPRARRPAPRRRGGSQRVAPGDELAQRAEVVARAAPADPHDEVGHAGRPQARPGPRRPSRDAPRALDLRRVAALVARSAARGSRSSR